MEKFLNQFKELPARKQITYIVDGIIYLLLLTVAVIYLAGAINNLWLGVIGLPLLIILNAFNGIIGYKDDPHKSKLDFIFAIIIIAFFILYLLSVIK